MAGIGEMMASAVVKEVVNKLASGIWERLMLSWDFKKDLEDMKITLSTLQSVLKDAEKRSIRNEAVCLWLKELKAAVYDIDDMLNDIPAEDLLHRNVEISDDLPRKVRRFLSLSNPLKSRDHMARKMKKMRERLEKIAARRKNFHFLKEESASNMQEEINRRESISEIDESMIYGRNEEKEIIVKLLLDTNCKENISVIPIVGIGGLGKTTLAKLAFNDERVRVFDLWIWVYVSLEFDLKRIAKAILSEARQGFEESGTLQSLSIRVKEILAGKRYLLVLDDMWSERQDDWENLKNILKGGKKESKILVTTRSLQVASIMGTIPPHPLKFLCGDDCWVLFKRRAFGSNGEQVDPSLEPIGREIVRKCGGVPLVVHALGSMMRPMKGKKTWENVRDSELWKLKGKDETSEDEILSSLKLSYHHMPSPMKQCFAYCSVFPRGYQIDKDKLIQQWIGQGFIQTADWSLSLEHGNDYFNHLLSMSFFQKQFYLKPGRVTYKMHDVIYNMVQSIAGDEVLVLDTGKRISDAKWCRYVSVIGCEEIPKKQAALLERVRALHFRCCGFMELRYDIFSWTKCLRILDLTGWFTDQFPMSVYQLKQLRYLDMSQLPIRRLHESIGDLQNLQMLNLSYCSLEEIPKSIGKLQKLQILNLAGCSNLQTLPQSIGNLQNLVNLNLLECHDVRTLPKSIGNLHNLVNLNLSECHELRTLPESIGNLQNLVNLNLSHELRILPESIGNLQNLVNLNLSHELQTLPESIKNLRNPVNVNLLRFHGLRALPKSLRNLSNLVYLNFSDCHKSQIKDLGPDGMSHETTGSGRDTIPCVRTGRLGNVPVSQLGHLVISPVPSVGMGQDTGTSHSIEKLKHPRPTVFKTLLQTLPKSLGNLQNPVNLNLSDCHELQTLPESIGNLQNLVNLNLSDCRELQTLPESIGNLQNLENLNLSGCCELQTLPESIGNLQNLVNLRLSYCYNLRTLPESIRNLQNLRNLNLSACQQLQTLPESIGCLRKLCSLDLSYGTFTKQLPDPEPLTNLVKSNANLKVKR